MHNIRNFPNRKKLRIFFLCARCCIISESGWKICDRFRVRYFRECLFSTLKMIDCLAWSIWNAAPYTFQNVQFIFLSTLNVYSGSFHNVWRYHLSTFIHFRCFVFSLPLLYRRSLVHTHTHTLAVIYVVLIIQFSTVFWT